MPQWGSQDYKKAVFEQLARGSGQGGDDDHFQHFENFSAGAPRRDVEAGVGEASTPSGSIAGRSSRSSAPPPRRCIPTSALRSPRT